MQKWLSGEIAEESMCDDGELASPPPRRSKFTSTRQHRKKSAGQQGARGGGHRRPGQGAGSPPEAERGRPRLTAAVFRSVGAQGGGGRRSGGLRWVRWEPLGSQLRGPRVTMGRSGTTPGTPGVSSSWGELMWLLQLPGRGLCGGLVVKQGCLRAGCAGQPLNASLLLTFNRSSEHNGTPFLSFEVAPVTNKRAGKRPAPSRHPRPAGGIAHPPGRRFSAQSLPLPFLLFLCLLCGHLPHRDPLQLQSFQRAPALTKQPCATPPPATRTSCLVGEFTSAIQPHGRIPNRDFAS